MIFDLANFMMIGLLMGVVVRFVATERNRAPVAMSFTMVPGVIGALLGGMASWRLWPADKGLFHFGAVAAAILGGAAAVLLAVVVLRRRGTLG